MSSQTSDYDKALIRSLRKKLHIRTTENMELREENKALKAEKKVLKAEIARIKHNHRRNLRSNLKRSAERTTQRYLNNRRQYNPDDWA